MIPLPRHIEYQTGEFRLTQETSILADAANRWNADYLHELLAVPTGFPLPLRAPGRDAVKTIRLRTDPALESLGRQGYRLKVRPAAVTIEAPETAGVFYGLQTLRQLLPVEVESRTPVSGVEWHLPCVFITDWPRFAWRGFMLDEGRHFQGREIILLTLDLMALQKLNILHWHLTEDQGWRIEIKKYPKLTEIGSRRAGTSRTLLGRHDGFPHGGYYTQEEIKEIVDYAAKRQITIVPEIEMPGHSLAALASYPEFSCTGGPFEVTTHFGIYPDIYCAGKDATFTFLQDVLDEIMALFPSQYIHIGGDEAPKTRWKKCPDCQRRMWEARLKDERALQVYFMNRIMAHLKSRGRRSVGWNQILHEGLAENAVVHYWLGNQESLTAAIKNEKRQVIMSTYLDTYLDHSYSLMPLSRAYRYEPIPPGLNEDEAACILGLEFPLWAEWAPDRLRLEYQTYPRLTAMAETGWTPKEKKDYRDFRLRLDRFLLRLDRLGVGYAPLKEAEPSWFKRLFGIFTIAQPQTKTSGDASRQTVESSPSSEINPQGNSTR